jgi:hypothetical protein
MSGQHLFCTDCHSLMRSTTFNGVLNFKCICGLTVAGRPEDTLRAEEYLEAAQSGKKYEVLIENSATDAAGQKVAIECLTCAMPFLTLVYIGPNMIPIYCCTCGSKFSANDLEKSADTN